MDVISSISGGYRIIRLSIGYIRIFSNGYYPDIIQTTLDGEMIKIKIVDLDELNKLGIQNFSI